jgi:hypothetical protein
VQGGEPRRRRAQRPGAEVTGRGRQRGKWKR